MAEREEREGDDMYQAFGDGSTPQSDWETVESIEINVIGADEECSGGRPGGTAEEDELEQIEIDQRMRMLRIEHNERRLRELEEDHCKRKEDIARMQKEAERAEHFYREREQRLDEAAKAKFRQDMGYDVGGGTSEDKKSGNPEQRKKYTKKRSTGPRPSSNPFEGFTGAAGSSQRDPPPQASMPNESQGYSGSQVPPRQAQHAPQAANAQAYAPAAPPNIPQMPHMYPYPQYPYPPPMQYAPNPSAMTSPPPFEGNRNENYPLFEHQLRAAMQVHKIPPQEQVPMLLLRLKGKAQKFFISLPDAHKADLETAIYYLRKRYQNPNRAWTHSTTFKNRIWDAATESIEDYLLELRELAELAFPTPAEREMQVREQFKEGIPGYLKKKIITKTNESLAQWVERLVNHIAIDDACPDDRYDISNINAVKKDKTENSEVLKLLNVIQDEQKRNVRITKNATDKIETMQYEMSKAKEQTAKAIAEQMRKSGVDPSEEPSAAG